MAEKPKHACNMTLTIGGHTRQDIADVLLDLAVKVGNDEAGINGCGGGPGGSYDYELSIGDSPTSREYHNLLKDYVQAKRERDAFVAELVAGLRRAEEKRKQGVEALPPGTCATCMGEGYLGSIESQRVTDCPDCVGGRTDGVIASDGGQPE